MTSVHGRIWKYNFIAELSYTRQNCLISNFHLYDSIFSITVLLTRGRNRTNQVERLVYNSVLHIGLKILIQAFRGSICRHFSWKKSDISFWVVQDSDMKFGGISSSRKSQEFGISRKKIISFNPKQNALRRNFNLIHDENFGLFLQHSQGAINNKKFQMLVVNVV